MKIIIVHNPKSGSALPESNLEAKCKRAGIKVEKFIALGKDLERELRPYLNNKNIIAAIGGDGTISAVASIIQGTSAILAPLPGGTLNHFTKDLDIPQNIDKSLAGIEKTQMRQIDIASVNDVYFINNSSIGLYPTSLKGRDKWESKIGKWPAAIWASLQALIRFRTYSVQIDGRDFKTPFIFIGNNRYQINDVSADRASLDEGVLTVFIAKTQSRFELIKDSLKILFRKSNQFDNFDIFHPKNLTIETSKSELSVSYDGEISKLKSPLRYKINPKTLNILG